MSWQGLTIRLKQEIIQLLDYGSRCNLRLCSSSDRETVDSTKIIATELKVIETESEMAVGKTVVRFDIDTFTIWFIGRENVTRIDRGWNGEIIEGFSETRQQNRYDVIGEFLKRFTRKGFVWINTIYVEDINFAVPETWIIKCANLKLYCIRPEHYLGWLRKFVTLCQKYKTLEIGCRGNEAECKFTDEQLDEIEAMDLKILSPNVTAEAVKKRLKKFLKHGKKGDELQIHTLRHENFVTQEQLIPKGLILKRIKTENEQEGRYHGHIIGGFENVHGIQDPREIHFVNFGELILVHCKMYEMNEKPQKLYCTMYPF